MMTPLAKPFEELVGLPISSHSAEIGVHGTTVLALRFKEGVVTFADRRATMGNLIMFEQAEKIMSLDDFTVVAISGSFARSIEVCRYLKHSFKYYRRSVLQYLSLEGIISAYDVDADKFGIYFFDGAGAKFENAEYAATGSGSERIRGIFEYMRRVDGSFEEKSLDQVVEDGLHMLDIAATLDSATGGFSRIEPIVRVLTKEGNTSYEAKKLHKAMEKVLKAAKPL